MTKLTTKPNHDIDIAKRQSMITLATGVSVMAMGLANNNAYAKVDFTTAMQSRILGDVNAPVTIIEYASMTCGHCAKFHKEILPTLKEKYIDTGKAKLDYRDFPLDAVALNVSMLLRCLPTRLYFRALDVVFKKQSDWLRSNSPVEHVQKMLSMAGLTPDMAQACLSNAPLQEFVIQSRMSGAKEHAVSGTPTIIIGKKILTGVRPMKEYKKAIKRML